MVLVRVCDCWRVLGSTPGLLCVVLMATLGLLDKLRRDDLVPWDPASAPGSPPGSHPRGTADLPRAPARHRRERGLNDQGTRHLLCDHAAGNYRILIGMAATCS